MHKSPKFRYFKLHIIIWSQWKSQVLRNSFKCEWIKAWGSSTQDQKSQAFFKR